MNKKTTNSSQPKKRRRFRIIIVLAVVGLIGLVGWQLAKRSLHSQLKTQLTDLDIGDPVIGGVSIKSNGVEAQDIQFYWDGESDPWLTVERLSVNHPIGQLVAGAEEFNELELEGLWTRIDLDLLSEPVIENSADDESRNFRVDLSQFNFPAERLKLNRSKVLLHFKGKPDLEIRVTGMTLAKKKPTTNDDSTSLEIDGSIEQLAGGDWTLRGSIRPDQNSLDVKLHSDEIVLNTQQWQSWPLVPDGTENIVNVDGKLGLSINLAANEDDGFQVSADGKIRQVNVNLPGIDLPISIHEGDLSFVDNKIVLDDFSTSIVGGDIISGSLESKIGKFPIETSFETKFKDVSIQTWRKLVGEIPRELTGGTSGTASGTVFIQESTRATINLDAKGAMRGGTYGEIDAENISANVNVLDLVFNEKQLFESVAGHVDVDADFTEQPIVKVLNTFALQSLQKQMEFAGAGNGTLKMKLPLASVEDMKSWTLKVDALVPNGSIGGQAIENMRTDAELIDGFLLLKNIASTSKGNVVEEASENSDKLEVIVRWPMASDDADDTGEVRVTGTNVSTAWINGFAQHQIEAVTLKPNPEPLTDELSRLGGTVSFSTDIKMPSARPDEIANWILTGNIRDSHITVDQHNLSNIASLVQMKNGQLEFNKLRGDFTNGGKLSGSVNVDLQNYEDHRLNLDAVQVPAAWLANVMKDTIPEFRSTLDSNGLTWATEPDQLSGILNANLSFDNASHVEDGFRFDFRAGSAELVLPGTELRDLNIVGSVDADNFRIEKFYTAINREGSLDLSGDWSLKSNSGTGNLQWEKLPIDWLTKISVAMSPGLNGSTSGKVSLSKPVSADDKTTTKFAVEGTVGFNDLNYERFKMVDLACDIATREGFVYLENVRNDSREIGIDVSGKVALESPYSFEVSGELDSVRLSQLFERSKILEANERSLDLTGVLRGTVGVKGQFENFDWRTNGELDWLRPALDGKQFSDVKIDWEHPRNDWKNSRLKINAFDGIMEMVELSSAPHRVRMRIEDIEAEQLALVLELPTKFAGRLSGEASLNDWGLTETRWADLIVKGSSILVGPNEFGDFQVTADYRNSTLTYDLDGSVLDGRLVGNGTTEIVEETLAQTSFPLELQLSNASLNGLYRGSNYFNSLRKLTGRLSANADLTFDLDGTVKGDGRIGGGEVKWDRELLTREASVRFRIVDQRIVFDDLRADLKRGSIAAKAIVPLAGTATGSYEANLRDLDLERLAKVLGGSVEAKGLLDGRISGQLGRTITGQGFVGVHRATVNGISGQSLRLPIQFRFSPLDRTGKIELRRSTFRVFNGNASGAATISFGNVVNVDVDLKVSNVDTEKLLTAVAGLDQSDQGKLTGRFQLKGRGVRSTRDLKGSFRGSLQQVSAFKLPVLSDAARVIAGANIQTADYDSDEILLRLDNNRISVQQLNFSSSFVKIAITGDAYLDGRLNLSAAARIDRLRQSSLLEELAGSPLIRLSNSPAAFFARAAEFLSERIVFLRIGGTFDRPSVRIDSSQQLKEETIRYFLRGSQILPYGIRQNN